MLMNLRNPSAFINQEKLDLSPWRFQYYQSIAELVLLEHGLGSARFAIVSNAGTFRPHTYRSPTYAQRWKPVT
jgi:hypothetical protein